MAMIEIKTKTLNKKKCEEILHKLFDMFEKLRVCEYEAFLSVNQGGKTYSI